MLLSAGGAHFPHKWCMAGNVTPYRNEEEYKEVYDMITNLKKSFQNSKCNQSTKMYSSS